MAASGPASDAGARQVQCRLGRRIAEQPVQFGLEIPAATGIDAPSRLGSGRGGALDA
jgi:hypothetical protein